MDNISLKSQKIQRLIAFLLVNAIQYPCSLKSNIYHWNKRRPSPFFHFDTNPALGHVLIHFVDKTDVLVAAVKLIRLLFLNILSFTFVLTPNKFLRLNRFRKKLCKLPWCCFNQPHKLHFLFARCALRCSMWSRSLLSCSNVVNFKVNKQMKRCETVIHKHIKINNWSQTFHQPQNNVFSLSPFSRGGNRFSFLCTSIWSVMN